MVQAQEKGIITKTVIKDFASKECPYLAALELNERSLVSLLKASIDSKNRYKELVQEQIEENPDDDELDDFFNIEEILKDHPQIRKEIQKYSNSINKNKAERLIDDYNDDQIVSKLSREYFIEKYGKEHCGQCDINDAGELLINQYAIVQKTETLINDPNIKVIFEGQVEINDLRARFDVLIKTDDGKFEIIEVKGTNDVFVHPKKNDIVQYDIDSKIKPKYLYDFLFQYYVYSNKYKTKISSLKYMFTNRDFRLKNLTYPIDKSELDSLFVIKDHINLKDDGEMLLIKYFDDDKYIYDTRSKDKVVNKTIEELIMAVRDVKKNLDKGIKVNPCIRYSCRKGPACPFMDICFPDVINDNNSILKLTNWNLYGGNHNTTKNYMEGLKEFPKIDKISDILLGAEFVEKKYKKPNKESRLDEYGFDWYRPNVFNQIKFQKGGYKAKYVMDEEIVKTILKKSYLNDEIEYLLFFDFESFQYPIPLVEYSGCWQQIVNQYSMHIVKKGYDLSKHNFKAGDGGLVKHYEFIADPDQTKFKNPCVDLFTKLKEQLEDFGIDPYGTNYRVVVFNKNFEKTRMKEFVRDFYKKADDSLINFVVNFNNKVVDLLDFFTFGGLYCVDFNGRGSLKVVQPTLAKDKDVQTYYKKIIPDLEESLEYHNNLVYNGAICLDLYKSLLIRSHIGCKRSDEPTTKELLAQALAYCKIDSWGTVIIYDVIKNICLKKLKVDLEYLK